MLPNRICWLARGLGLLSVLLLEWTVLGQAVSGPRVTDSALESKFAELLRQVPAMSIHEAGLTVAGQTAALRQQANYRRLLEEKVAQNWFAAFVSTSPEDALSIQTRFKTWRSFSDFLLERNALVELWAYPESGVGNARRIPATEVAQLRRERFEQPLLVTATYLDPASGQAVKRRVEFGFGAASHAAESQQAYLSQREMQEAAREVLAARDDNGQLNARAQWDALGKAANEGRFPLVEMPQEPDALTNLFLAVEYSVGPLGYLDRPLRLWRESEVKRKVAKESRTNYIQVLVLKKAGEKAERQVRAYRVRGVSEELEPVPSPVPGQDAVELRIQTAGEPDPRKWNLLEFGEPEVLRQASLARFSLINAHLEKRRKEIALKKSRLDLIAEPIFAGLSIGAGVAGVLFPVGEAARLGYNAAVVPWFIPPVPTAKQMRELFRLMTAREKDAILRTKAACFLTEDDVRTLRDNSKTLTDAEVAQYLSRITDEDVRGMLYLARMHFFDAEFTNLMNIMAGAGKVSGWTDDPGLQRDILNSIYFSVNGDISIKNIIAVLAGGKVATPLSGYALEDLAKGSGPGAAWLQYLDFTVDVRAVANTISRLLAPGPAERELEMPFPYATRMTDPAAYEIRIFGFPMLMFYKRGLLKDDYAAFTNDFAYGLITTRIVEHFETREQMDEEIRAGRMVPLGFVKVPGARGGWKDTNLALFAHRIARGRHKGKTSIVLYGLKAYQEHSDLIEREYLRLKRFHQACSEGGVIEQVIDAERLQQLPRVALEPEITAGENAAAEKFAPLLGCLLENRRLIQLKTLGVPLSEADQQDWRRLRSQLATAGISTEAGAPDPLLGVDRYNSSFLYRRSINGQWQVVKMVSIPGKAEMLRELVKAQEGAQLERLRREAVGPEGDGIVLLNTALPRNGTYEVGPLLQRDGKVLGNGVQPGSKALNAVFNQIAQLPVVERARLKHRQFAGMLMKLDVSGTGKPERVFVTIEFPFGKEMRQLATNTLSGETEILTFRDGQLRQIATGRRLTALEYDDSLNEIASTTFLNRGTLQQPLKGAVVEQTRTLETWLRDLRAELPEPSEPILTKLKLDYLTGAVSRELYGLFPLPVATADEMFVVSNRFDAFGKFVSASTCDNGRSESDFQRPPLEATLNPIPGRPRFESGLAGAPPGRAGSPSAGDFLTTVVRKDLVKDVSKTQVVDNASYGRLASESWTEALGEAGLVSAETRFEYRDDFFAGRVPVQSSRKSASGKLLSKTTTLRYDNLSRKLTAWEEDYTGTVRTNTWDYRYDAPVQSETARRRTVIRPGRDGTTFTSTTTSQATGEELTTGTGLYEPNSKTWTVHRVHWFRPGVTNRVETETRSALGTLLSTRIADRFEARPAYDADGLEQTNRVFRRNAENGAFSIPHRIEADYRWQGGQRDACVQTYLEGQPYDTYRTVSDAEGRLLQDGIRQYGNLRLLTRIAYDGDSDRVLSVRELQNDQLRTLREPVRECPGPNGEWLLPVVTTPTWGLISTQEFALGDILARPTSTTLENGDVIQVRDWFPDSAVARVAEVLNRQRQPRERYQTKPNAGMHEGVPYDRVTRSLLTFWGVAAPAAEESLLRGTDIALFADAADERTLYDLEAPFRAPRVIIDPYGLAGRELTVSGTRRSNVLALCRTRIQKAQPGEGARPPGSVLLVEKADVRGLFSSRLIEQTYDRSGHLLAENLFKAANIPGKEFSEDGVFGALRTPLARFGPKYQRGWLVETNEPESGRVLAWSREAPAAGSRSFTVNDGPFPDIATETEGFVYPGGDDAGTGTARHMPRVMRAPRFLERNPYMPDRTDAWVEWSTVDFAPNGKPLTQRRTVFDGQGRSSVQKVWKRTAAGKPAIRIAYYVTAPSPKNLNWHDVPAGEHLVALNQAGRSDFSGSDFLCLFAGSPLEASLKISDKRGRSVLVRRGASNFARGAVEPWHISPLHVRWLPDDAVPVQGTELGAPEWLVRSGTLLPVSVHDLDRAGLDIRNITAIELVASNAAPARLLLSDIQVLNRDAPFVRDHDWREYYDTEFAHSSGLRTTIRREQGATERDGYAGQRMGALVTYNGLPTATARAHSLLAKFPHVLWLDGSDFEVPGPLYSVSDLDGHFLEHYSSFRLGDALLQVTPPAFEAPRLELYRADVLQDELYPGRVFYGHERQLEVAPLRGTGVKGKTLTKVRQRVEANGFRVEGQRLLSLAGLPVQSSPAMLSSNLPSLYSVTRQAAQISLLPTVAEALVGTRRLPWETAPAAPETAPVINWGKVGLELGRLHLLYAKGLIPTAPGTDAERYVDTVAEADIIRLASQVDIAVANGLLAFYWQTSHGGELPLLSSYDAQAGTGMKADVLYRRPRQAEVTAEAQLAIADAAFQLGLETSSSNWLTLGRNLLTLVLDEFRVERPGNGVPRGIAELPVKSVRRVLGSQFWPEANYYSLRSNARAYLILKRLRPIAAERFRDEAWHSALTLALSEQQNFLKSRILPEVERTGVVPMGLFEMQDIIADSSALGAERWSSADDWLWFLEAAAEMGVPGTNCRAWLDNAARVHGVQVGGVWGLDWRVATLRPDAASPALTARFARLARAFGHDAAESFADRNLAVMQREGGFPVVITEAPPTRALPASQEFSIRPATNHLAWPTELTVYQALRERERPGWDLSNTAAVLQTAPPQTWPERRTDVTAFVLIAGGVYLSVLGSALFWWGFRSLRRKQKAESIADAIVPARVMQWAEERWAKRVMGLSSPPGAEHWRYSNAPVEQNFLSQLRAVYKLVLEWRRLDNHWAEDDRRLLDDANDEWLNGADEFATLVGLYMRTVIKAGAKDGFAKADVLSENEDSNHIWARLAMFFSEHLWSLSAAVQGWQASRGGPEEKDYRNEIQHSLQSMGLRERLFGFDARELFNCPANPEAFDLLVVQAPNMPLRSVMEAASAKLDIPLDHIVRVITLYKEFKKHENPYPVHPYLLEFAKELPHFALMGLGAIIAYNQHIHDNPIVPYLKSVAINFGLSARSLPWALPLLGGLLVAVFTHFLRVYRHKAAIHRHKAETFLDRSVTSLFVKRAEADPTERTGRWSHPDVYERCGWALRAVGFSLLAYQLFHLDTPSFATFLIVKGMFGMIALAEVAGVVLPLLANLVSRWLQDWVSARAPAGSVIPFLNRLNITASRPASPLWLSIKYHAQPSMPTGTALGLTQAVVFYFALAATFFFGAGYLCQQIFSLWFTDTYLEATDWKLVIGGLVFAVTMILLRYGLFVLFTAVASFIAAFPSIAGVAVIGAGQLVFVALAPQLGLDAAHFLPTSWAVAFIAVAFVLFEKPLRDWVRSRRPAECAKAKEQAAEKLRELKSQPDRKLGVVYMSGDELSGIKLTPELCMTRWRILREKLDSRAVPQLARFAGQPDDATLRLWFQNLYDLEKKSGVTLWHPMQLRLQSPSSPASGTELPPELGLNLAVASEAEREQVLFAWHLRRWLASMMSTAGHSQDTAINLVDIALRLEKEGLAGNTVFYLIQNKYDNNSNNRPSQAAYDKGELDHRNKLARLLCAVAPGASAWCLQDWTPFGFKSGGLSGMDLVYEESLQLNTLLLLDRNATVHDLDALMLDLLEALTDPNVVIVVPGRGTTNTLTPMGQASQLVEEGHRSFLRGLISYLGGSASESVGTGWGNILACFYGRVQRSLLSVAGRKMPVTSRMKRGTTFADRTEGLIGFGPHAVGISEDIWAVVQAMNNALGLGYQPRFALSRALWHKIRETWSHGEWLASFPRWAGGYLQMANDPLMQRINDLGPQPVFSRDIRCSAGRNFMAAPLALLNILLMPLAIIFDVSPFVQMLFVLWNCGFVLNQVLTLHALNTYLENSGFQRVPALLGMAASALACYLNPACRVIAPGLVVLGFLTGGFFVGLSHWVFTRLRDLILFGPQLVMQTLAHTVRLSLEFIVSGTSAEDAKSVNLAFRAWAGPREDRPLERFPNFINLRTVIWLVGLVSAVLCVFALMNLDMLNVLLLLPSLLFSVSTLAGPFLATPARGKPLGPWTLAPRLAGWAGAAAVYVLASLCIYWGGWLRWAGVALLVLVFGAIAAKALKYLPFRARVNRLKKHLAALLITSGVKAAKADAFAGRLMQLCATDVAKVSPELQRVGMSPEQLAPIASFAREKIGPVLVAPVLDMQRGWLSQRRWAIEWSRAFVLGMLALFWFFLVPVPALIVFTAGSYRFTFSLENILLWLGAAVALAILAETVARLIQLIQARGLGGEGLHGRLHRYLARLRQLPGELSHYQIASGFALLTDVQTYLDQRSYARADRSLRLTENIIGNGNTERGAPSKKPGS